MCQMMLDNVGGLSLNLLKIFTQHNVAFVWTGLSNQCYFLYSNGDLDPWSGGGVTKSISDSLVAVMIHDGAHHLDLRHKNSGDPQSVIDARDLEKKYMKQWIMEWKKSKSNTVRN